MKLKVPRLASLLLAGDDEQTIFDECTKALESFMFTGHEKAGVAFIGHFLGGRRLME